MDNQVATAFIPSGPSQLLVLLIPFFVTIFGTPIARDIAIKLGIVDAPIAGSSKIHEKPIPYLGGLPLFAAMVAGMLIVFHETHSVLPDGFLPWLAIASLCLIFLVGLWDDLLGMTPGVKMLMLAISATALFFAGGRITFIPETWGIAGQVISWLLTVFWILGITNSANLMDNMNGLAAGMGIVAGLAMFGIAAIGKDPVGIGLSLILLGGLLGYIPYNYPKAQIFFGDAGSIALGFYLSFLGLIVGRMPAPEGFSAASHTLAPIVVVAVFVFDTFFVAFSRGKRKINFWWGGKDHTSHRFVNFGFSKQLAVVLCWLLGAIAGGFGLLIKISPGWLGTLLAVFMLASGIWFWRQLEKVPVEAVVIGASNVRERRFSFGRPKKSPV